MTFFPIYCKWEVGNEPEKKIKRKPHCQAHEIDNWCNFVSFRIKELHIILGTVAPEVTNVKKNGYEKNFKTLFFITQLCRPDTHIYRNPLPSTY
jgi:hypothetical protein